MYVFHLENVFILVGRKLNSFVIIFIADCLKCSIKFDRSLCN